MVSKIGKLPTYIVTYLFSFLMASVISLDIGCLGSNLSVSFRWNSAPEELFM